MSDGKSFNMHALAAGKMRRPTVESLTAGTNRPLVVEHFVFVEIGYLEH